MTDTDSPPPPPRPLARLMAALDLRDCLFFGGLLMAAVGVAWLYHPAAALIAVGSVLAFVAKRG
jgi:hypothetical protein